MSGRPNKEENSSGGVGLLGGLLIGGAGVVLGAIGALMLHDTKKNVTQHTASARTGPPPNITSRMEQRKKNNVPARDNNIPEGAMCGVCYENEKEIVFQPCNHACVCEDCAGKLTECPLCRKIIISKNPIYLA